jgi:uncharacterized protein YegP (UPF0339 family)
MYFAIRRSKNGQYWWRAVGDNNEIMAASELMTTKQSCEHAVRVIKAEAAAAPVHDQSGPTGRTAAEDTGARHATVEKTAELSERVLGEVKNGQQSAIEAVRRFMDSVDKALSLHGENPSRRQEVIDSALELSEKLVQTQYDFLRGVVHSAGETLGESSKNE